MSAPCDTGSADHLTVYFDGACPVCSREVGFYDRIDRAGAIGWHDVSESEGDLGKDGVSQSDALARLHARLPDGQMVTGVQAFIAFEEKVLEHQVDVLFLLYQEKRNNKRNKHERYMS